MRRRTIGVIGGLGLAAVLATGWLVVAQPPGVPSKVGDIIPPPAVPPAPTPPPQSPNSPPQDWQVQNQAAVGIPPQAITPAPQPTPVPVQPVPHSPKAAPSDLVQELIQIINETRSVDTFFVTTKLLEGMGVKARVAVPALIRNAERLELFKDAFLNADKDGEKQTRMEAASMIVDALDKIMNGPTTGATNRPTMQVAPPPPPSGTRPAPADPLVTPTSGRLSRPPIVETSPLPPGNVAATPASKKG